MIKYVGIDPSQRHTGVCILTEGCKPLFCEIKTDTLDVLSSGHRIKQELWNFLERETRIDDTIFTIEKQLSKGGHTGPLLFYIQMLCLEIIKSRFYARRPQLAMPLPIQFKSYMSKIHGVDTKNKTAIVKSFKERHKWVGRISQHKVEAFYLAQLGADVKLGIYKYKLPSKEFSLTPWRVLNGGQC